MLTLAVLSGPWPRIGVVLVVVCAAAAILLRDNRRRAWAMLGALILCPVLLLEDVSHSGKLRFVSHHPAEAVVGVVVVLMLLALAAQQIHRRPWVLGPLAVVALPFRIPINTGGSSSNLLVPLYFVIGAAALAWIVPTLWAARRSADPAGRSARREAPLLFEKLLAAYLVLYALQSLYASNSGLLAPSSGLLAPSAFEKALQNVTFFYVPFAILLSLLRDLRWDRALVVRCLGLTIVLAVIFAGIGFYEEATKTVLLSSKLAVSNQQHSYFTVDSVFFDPNIFGRYLALVMVLVTGVLLYDRRPKLQVTACGVLAILWVGMLFTLSRSSLVALLLGLAVLAALRWRIRPVLTLAVAVVIAGGIVIAVSPHTFGLNQGLNGASSGRENLVTGGIRLFSDRPLQGYGSGSFTSQYSLRFPRAAGSVDESHDIPVTIAAEQGLIGLLVYAALVIAAIIALARGCRRSPARVAVLAAFLALLLHTFLYADFLEDPVTWVLLAIGAALVVANPEQEEVSVGGAAAVRQEPAGQFH